MRVVQSEMLSNAQFLTGRRDEQVPCRGGAESDDLAAIEQSSSKVTSAPTARRFLVDAHERVSEV